MTSRYFTTPLYYVNAAPHLGHFYTTALADTLTRHYRQRGDDVWFLTGTDEHGQKVAEKAQASGEPVKAFVDRISAEFQSTWDTCNLKYDRFYRTTEPNHYKAVQAALTQLKEKGEIVFREYEGLYDVGAERFVKESELTPEGLCPDTLTKPERRKEANYFFLMSRYQDRLIELFEKNPQLIKPDSYRNEMLSFLKSQPLEDLCISRPVERLSWGIPFPFDEKFVTYVWFDALLNYLVATGWPDSFNEKRWESVTHLIAKDILKTHSIYWTSMLLALGVPPYRALRVHGYWLMNQQKMSKTVGNIIRPLEIKEQFGLENLRYYLLRDMSFGLDSTFTLEAFIQTSNAHLANGIGNLASRVLTLANKNNSRSFDPAQLTDADRALLSQRPLALKAWNEGFDDYKFHQALKAWSDLVTAVDLYVNDQKPWALAKDPALKDRLDVVLGVCMNVLEALAVLGAPVIPDASSHLLKCLGRSDASLSDLNATRSEFNLSGETPRLFARLELPAATQ